MSAGERLGPTATKPKRYEIAKTERWKGHVETDAEAGAADDELEPWESNEERETLDETRIANRGTNLCPFLWVSLRESCT